MKKEITIEMDGKRYPATIDMPDEPEKNKMPFGIKYAEKYCAITTIGNIDTVTALDDQIDRGCMEIGNVYPARDLAEKAVELQKIKTEFTRRRVEIEGPELKMGDDYVHCIQLVPFNRLASVKTENYSTETFSTQNYTTAIKLIKEMGDDIVRAFQLMKELKNAGCVV